MENWKEIEGASAYEVSDLGRIRVIETGHVFRQFVSNAGYGQITMKRGGVGTKMVHRLVAKAFAPNPEGKPQVNHRDGNKLNNAAANLEWCTPEENMRHCYDTGLKTYKPLHYKGKFGAEHNRSKAVEQIGDDGLVIGHFGSASEAGRALAIDVSSICWACNRGGINRKTSTFFRYAAD